MTDCERYPRGSEWRKWDLHVHTPASFYWVGGKRLRQMTADERQNTFEEMRAAIESADAVAFALMDYWTFDGYLGFRGHMQEARPDSRKLVLPGIELRVEAPVNYRLNLQVIFSDDLSDQQLADFKAQLRIPLVGRSLSDEALQEFAGALGTDAAREHGFGPPETLTADELLVLGSKTAVISPDSLKAALKLLPRGTAYVIMPYETANGLEDLDWRTHPHADMYFLQLADIFESRSPRNANLFLGIRTPENEEFLDNFQKALGKRSCPVVCGSDAHSYDDYGVFPSGRATWIKANPSWEGLQQIVFEPRDRVRVQEAAPSHKPGYSILDCVVFRDCSANPRFGAEPVWLNPDLNAIIGGKSSGKSLLLYHTAKAVDPGQVTDKLGLLGAEGYDFEREPEFGFEVVWGDGARCVLGATGANPDRPITYIPQMYINHLAEQGGEQHLRTLVESVLGENEEYRSFRLKQNEAIAAASSGIAAYLQDVYALRQALSELRSALREIGESAAIQKQIAAIKSTLEALRQSSGFTAEENHLYGQLVRRRDGHEKQGQRYTAIRDAFLDFEADATESLLQNAHLQINSALARGERDTDADPVVARVLGSLARQKHTSLDALGNEFTAADSRVRVAIEKKVAKHSAALQVVTQQLGPFLSKVKNQQSMKDLQSRLGTETEKLVKIAAINKQVTGTIAKGKSARTELLGNYRALHSAYQAIANRLASVPFVGVDSGLLLQVSVEFSSARFAEGFVALFDRRSSLEELFGNHFDGDQLIYAPNTHADTIADIFDKISQRGEGPNSRLRVGHTQQEAATKLFGDFFRLRYSLSQRGTDMLKMSPGKRGLVLLELLLHLSNSEYPILIDQPEDNLDNRTIYNELNSLVRAKKQQRQIIFVTHNANLVVAADAENIIVANQSGQEHGKENRRYDFEYVSSGLECTFRDPSAEGILYQMGIREHVCDVLEGGEAAFAERERKYGLCH